MQKFLGAFLSLMLMIGTTQAAEFFDQSFGDFADEMQAAKDEGKLGVMLFFEMEDCPFCQRMKDTYLQEPDVVEYFNEHFKAYRFDIEGANPVTDFDGTEYTEQEMAEKKYRVRATPVMMIFDTEGNPMVRFTGPTRSKEEMLLLGKYVVDGAYKDMPFARYKRTQN